LASVHKSLFVKVAIHDRFDFIRYMCTYIIVSVLYSEMTCIRLGCRISEKSAKKTRSLQEGESIFF